MVRKNLTLQVDEEVIRRARVLAAERDTSLSGLVAQLVADADDAKSAEYRRAHTRWRALVKEVADRNRDTKQQPRNWTREDAYAERLDRFR